MRQLQVYACKALNGLYWWQDKLDKRGFVRSYPRYLRRLGIDIAEENGDTWISPTTFFDSVDYGAIHLGRDLTISFDVAILVHDYSVNNAMRAAGEPEAERHRMVVRPVRIGDNCFVGARSLILPGATIGDDCVVGAGSVVRGAVPPGSVVSGNPATVVCGIEELAGRHAIRRDFKLDAR